ncbi:MAG: LarC family nickel insertion protein [Synechococcaceae cyanobacterium]|nr:LarC family nickel insertion protein [Synechococcaceae cyanobacterium]
MTLALLDCPTGLAGDMLLAALFDLGVPEAIVEEPLAALGLAGRYRIRIEEGRSGGLRGRRLQVESLEEEPHHRPWGPLRQRILAAPLAPRLRERVLAVFTLLAEAEAAVHGHPPEQVHFHEVGAIDALVDIVGVCAGLLHLEVGRLICGVPPAGHGSVATAHGQLPLPAPAVLEIARRRALPLGDSGTFPPGELTTPTGLALVACWAEGFGTPPAHVPLAVGVGLGCRRLDRPNLLRLVLAAPLPPGEVGDRAESGPSAEAVERLEPLLQQQAQIDDASPEDLAFLAEALRQAGAVEVFSQAISMKKGRLGTLVTALLPPELAPRLRAVWWRHGTSLGVREQPQERWILPRRIETVDTPLGPVRLKRAALPGGGERRKPEHDDLAALAREHNLSLQQVRDLVEQAGGVEP